MHRLFVLSLLLIFPQNLLCVCAFPTSSIEQQQSSPAPQSQPKGECQSVPSCRQRISDLEAEINKLKGVSTGANKSRLSSLTRSLRRSKSALTRLEDQRGETRRRETSPDKRRAEPPAVSLSAPALTPQNFLNLLTSASTEKDKVIVEQTKKTGEIYILKNAAVGIIEINYDKTVKPGSPFSLKVTVTPRDIIEESFLQGISNAPVTCYIKPEYKVKKSKVEYDTYESDNKPPERELQSGRKITWVWNITPPSGFDTDTATLYVYAKFKVADHESDWQIVSDSEIEFKESRFDWIYSFIFNHALALLTLLTTLIGLFAAVKTYRAATLSNDLNVLRLESEKQQSLLNQTQKRLKEEQAAKNSLQVAPNASRRTLARNILILPKLVTFLIALALKWHRKRVSRD